MSTRRSEFQHPQPKEEEKTLQRKNSADYLLSQESIKQFEAEVEHEAKIERQRLDNLNKQKKEMAKALKEK